MEKTIFKPFQMESKTDFANCNFQNKLNMLAAKFLFCFLKFCPLMREKV